MRLTKKEKAQVYKAAEMLASDEEWYSCAALRIVSGNVFLTIKYAEFYEKDPTYNWLIDEMVRKERGPNRIGWRLTLLLFFAEAWEVE